ncbi:Phage tail assembly chaperone protein, TAC [Sphingomonas sp. YR710]|nr:phage tail assembly chaperone [Sphingomonas sp. YR710]SDC31033.1 Phage tail assembly chaperone protein, TAC [Sphingomonas sp. YR710]
MMGWAIVNLHWTPDQYWRATPNELWSAVEIFDDQAEARETERSK